MYSKRHQLWYDLAEHVFKVHVLGSGDMLSLHFGGAIFSTSYVWNFCPYFKHGCTARVQLVKAMHSYFKHGCTVHGQQHSDKNYKTASYY